MSFLKLHLSFLLVCCLFSVLTPAHAQEATVVDHSHPVYRFPDELAPIVSRVPQFTPVSLIARLESGDWLHVRARDSLWHGWLQASAIETAYDLSALPVETIEPADILNNVTFWNFSPTMREVFLRGQQLGNRADVFSKVGDSITVNFAFLQPFGKGIHNLGEDYAYLETALDFFNTDPTHPTTSFLEPSRAAKVGWRTSDLLERDDSPRCDPLDTRLACEYRLTRPAIALIMLGTNDVRGLSLQSYDTNMRRIVETSLEWGVIPVISTIPPQQDMDGQVERYNLALIQISNDYDVPLWNYWLAMQGLPNRGLSDDGVHPSVPPTTTNAAVFTKENLQYGFTVRNLMALQVLNLILYKIMSG